MTGDGTVSLSTMSFVIMHWLVVLLLVSYVAAIIGRALHRWRDQQRSARARRLDGSP